MAISDRLAREIADVKAQIDALNARHDADLAVLQARLQALKNLKQQWNAQLDSLCESAGVDVKEPRG